MSFSDRLELFCEASGLKKKDILEKTGVSRSIFFAYLRGDSQPTPKFFLALKEAFPWVNVEWLITGQGEMTSRKEDFSTYQVATGDGNIQAGGSVRSSGGIQVRSKRKVEGAREEEVRWTSTAPAGGNLADLVELLKDYGTPKMIDDLRDKLLRIKKMVEGE